MFPTNMPDRN